MAKPDLIAGLDIGGGKLTCIAAVHDPETNTLQVKAGRSIPCKGLRKSVVIDIQETSASVAHILGSIERACDQEISNLFVGLRGSHLESFSNHGTYNISHPDKEITQSDMEAVKENAKAMPLKNNNEIVHVVTQGYSIDKQHGIRNPEGMEGDLLEVDVHITTGSSTHINNLIKAIQLPGYKVDSTFYSLVPLADAVLTQEEKDIGALILDLGGETMSVGIYVNGILKFSRDIPYGCDLITSDLSQILHTSRANAKAIKEKYGVSFPTFLDEEGEIPVPSLDGRSTHNIKKSYVLDIIQPRVEELMEHVAHCVDNSGYKNYPVVGVVTGGGSLMPGITEHCVNILGLKEVRRGTIQRDLIAGDETYFEPQYSTAMALVIHAIEKAGYEAYISQSYGKQTSWLGKLRKLTDIFGN